MCLTEQNTNMSGLVNYQIPEYLALINITSIVQSCYIVILLHSSFVHQRWVFQGRITTHHFPTPNGKILAWLLTELSIWTHHHLHGTRNHNVFGFGVLCANVGANGFARPGRVLPCIVGLSAFHNGFGALLAILQTQNIQIESAVTNTYMYSQSINTSFYTTMSLTVLGSWN